MVTHKANRHTLLFPGALVGGDNPLVVGGVCAVDCIPCVRWKHETVLVSIAFEFVELRLLVCINFLCIGLVFLLGMHRPHCGNFSARPKYHELLKCSPHVLRAPLRLSQGKKERTKALTFVAFSACAKHLWSSLVVRVLRANFLLIRAS